jgi:hypothetical protein
MQVLPALFAVIYFVCIIAIIIYVLGLLGRLVSAVERAASSLEIVASKLPGEGK